MDGGSEEIATPLEYLKAQSRRYDAVFETAPKTNSME